MQIPFDNSYARFPDRFYARLAPIPVAEPSLIRVNEALCALLGIDATWLSSPRGVSVLAGNAVPDGATPIATVYAGHQFGSWNPQLGDGRAILLGEVVGKDSERYDVQLKGSGPTPYSRGGDGRSPLGPVLREYIISEAMFALGVPTTRSLAAVQSGEQVHRQTPLPGGVLTRVARSHIRVGTFEFFASRDDTAALSALTEHVLARHYPDLGDDLEFPALALLEQVIARQAKLIARWLQLGFIHGVMNTDNMLVSGETIDYGPCAFMDGFEMRQVYSSIDHGGRYAYGNQPPIAAWNLACLAQALLPIIKLDEDAAVERCKALIEGFMPQFKAAYREGMRDKLGLFEEQEGDDRLIDDLFLAMQQSSADFTLTFRRLTDLAADSAPRTRVGCIYSQPEQIKSWLERWQARIGREDIDPSKRQASMSRVNPALIPRNHVVQEALDTAEQKGDFTLFHRVVDALQTPYDYQPDFEWLARPPRDDQIVAATFCGT
jgi:uncharacterized protein YdiU (UPF0061 family)